MTTMNEKRSITELAATKFSSLVSEWKFREPLIQEEKWMTRLSFLHDIGIAIEIEIDWRELEVFVLLVRLEHGSLPGGYYVSNGRVCRKHLVNVLREQGWIALNRRERRRKSASRTPEAFEESIERARTLVLDHVAQIVSRADVIFGAGE